MALLFLVRNINLCILKHFNGIQSLRIAQPIVKIDFTDRCIGNEIWECISDIHDVVFNYQLVSLGDAALSVETVK